ncbi:MAG: preprotein translocase subunit SecG [Hyphomicrobiales bacterium]|nr:MAG: preprotein translocase subunit SecG [Hyphomicrobiales bacterium]
MSTVVIVIHLMVVVSLIATVLLQRSEGGALGIGGGGNGNVMTGRGAANALTRATTFLAAGFFATSIALSVIANVENRSGSVLDGIPDSAVEGSGNGILDQLPGALPDIPAEPAAPAAPVSE